MEQAEGTLRRCATHAEGDSRTQRLLGEALFAQRAFEEALTCYDLALAAVRPIPFPSPPSLPLLQANSQAKRLGRPGACLRSFGCGAQGGLVEEDAADIKGQCVQCLEVTSIPQPNQPPTSGLQAPFADMRVVSGAWAAGGWPGCLRGFVRPGRPCELNIGCLPETIPRLFGTDAAPCVHLQHCHLFSLEHT